MSYIALPGLRGGAPANSNNSFALSRRLERILEHERDESSQNNLSSLVLIKRPYESFAVNAQVSNDARARRILVNNACDYRDGDFIVPARMDFGENIAVTVSTQGRAPSLAKKLKQKIQTEWANDLAKIEREFECK